MKNFTLDGFKKEVIWLNKAIFVLFVSILFIPQQAHAGLFSFMGDLVSEDVNASQDGKPVSFQNMALLEAPSNPDLKSALSPDLTIIDGSALVSEVGVSGTIADIVNAHPTQISVYTVRAGDTLGQIAKMFNVSVNTIVWSNSLKNGKIKEGDTLVILPVSGINHTVVKGDTLASIAKKYKADKLDIANFNGLQTNEVLAIGSTLIVPDGELVIQQTSSVTTTSKLRNAGGPEYKGYYIRPINGGVRTQGLHGYNGVDLANSVGTPIYASASGTVIVAKSGGYNGGYGSYVVISHPNGTQTLYGHASKVLVSPGDIVAQGDTIALLGNSGKSTGPHVHFEIRGAKNPF